MHTNKQLFGTIEINYQDICYKKLKKNKEDQKMNRAERNTYSDTWKIHQPTGGIKEYIKRG